MPWNYAYDSLERYFVELAQKSASGFAELDVTLTRFFEFLSLRRSKIVNKFRF